MSNACMQASATTSLLTSPTSLSPRCMQKQINIVKNNMENKKIKNLTNEEKVKIAFTQITQTSLT